MLTLDHVLSHSASPLHTRFVPAPLCGAAEADGDDDDDDDDDEPLSKTLWESPTPPLGFHLGKFQAENYPVVVVVTRL